MYLLVFSYIYTYYISSAKKFVAWITTALSMSLIFLRDRHDQQN